jgi:nucleoside-diphosphate-sugar epimerase
VINVALQPPNTLLHDGHRWNKYQPERLLRETEAGLRLAGGADLLIHASYLFAGARDAGAELPDALDKYIEAALEAEEMVLAGTTPACVVRLGYLYGPASHDLRKYRTAFRIARLYWSGPSDVKQRFLHTEDAISALLRVARAAPANRILAAYDNQPASFATFMDHFAKLVGNPLPLHVPTFFAPASRLFIAREHMAMTAMPTAGITLPKPRGFVPAYKSYRSGLNAVVDAWKEAGK